MAFVLVVSGCGKIQEIPVNDTEEASTESDGNATVADSTATHGSTSGDHDEVTAGEEGSGENTTGSGGEENEPVPFCMLANAEIPDDGTWVEMPQDIPEGVDAVSVTVGLRSHHPRVSDLEIEVVGPSGASATLLRDSSCAGGGLEAIFDDAAEIAAAELCGPPGRPAIFGAVVPIGSLAPLIADATAGSWVLRVRDLESGNTGSVENWCVALTTAP